MKNIEISGRIIGDKSSPFIIAEMSGNHNQSLDRALEIVKVAAECGVDAIKLQTYTPQTMTLNINEGDFVVGNAKTPWKGESLYSLYEKASTPWEWHKPIFECAKKMGLAVFSTPFDKTSVEFLEDLNAPCYKIASFENTDLELIKHVASTKKPIILSTGMATLSQLSESVQVARDAGCDDLVLLKCTSAYPASADTANLATLDNMRKAFDCIVGVSDHTMGIGVAIAGIALGARVIEKHFTLDRTEGGVDSSFSMEPGEMKQLTEEARRAHSAIGHIAYGPTAEDEASMAYRRSLYIVEDMKAGDILTERNLKSIRPGKGLEIKFKDLVMGKKINKSIKRGTPLDWSHVLNT